MAAKPEKLKLVHIATIPLSLVVIVDGQFNFMKSKGLDVHGIASGGEFAEKVRHEMQVPLDVVEMSREITPWKDLKALVDIWRCLGRIRPQIVHTHTPKGSLLGILGAWFSRVPLRIYHMHGLRFMTATSRQRTVLIWAEKITCLFANQVWCDSHSVREVAITERLCPPHKIKVPLKGSANGVDTAQRFNPDCLAPDARAMMRRQYAIPENARVIGFAGRIVRDKGLIELIEAWTILRESYPDLHLLMLGPFESEDPVPDAVKSILHQDPRIHVTNFVDFEWVAPLYSAMDIFVLPTYREGFPITLLEAAAMRLPIVATRIPGCIDAVEDGVTATLVTVRDASALAEAIGRYLDNPDQRAAHGRAGRERVRQHFQQERIWEWIYQEYQSLLAQRHLV